MGLIKVEGIKLYAYHGCLDQEAAIGGNYIVDVTIDTDFSEAALSDNLEETIDYVLVYQIVKEEMAIRSRLIEQVAQRISASLKAKFGAIINLEVKVTKLSPPMNGDVEKVSVTVG